MAAAATAEASRPNLHMRRPSTNAKGKSLNRPGPCASLSLLEPAPSPEPPRTLRGCHMVHWFRKGLRLHDNPALLEGLKGADTFRCVFVLDPVFATSSNIGTNKWRFLLQCLQNLDLSLKKLNSRLFVLRGQPGDVLPRMFEKWCTTLLTFEEDPEPFGRIRDFNIMAKCRKANITVLSRVSHTLYNLDEIIEQNGGKAPLTYHQFQTTVAGMPPPALAVPAVEPRDVFGVPTPIDDDHDVIFGVPTLEELGFKPAHPRNPEWVGGETVSLKRLKRYLERKAWVASFGRSKMSSQSLIAGPTCLSPYLRFGCLSPRLFYYQLTELYKRVKQEQPPLSLHGQLLWREFFYCQATRNSRFDRMEGNPICVQIPWQKDQDALDKWTHGQTGFPWIDAIMIQLRTEGWIHHIAQHAAACFLTRGDLWLSWEEGMKVFDEFLLDGDWSTNAGMWMWLSCSTFFQQFLHCYCPVRFGRKIDPNGEFVRRYIPVLSLMPTRYVHSPWLAPELVQRGAKCVVGRDYPLPMVNHETASVVNMERIRQVYVQLTKFKPSSSEPMSSMNKNARRPKAVSPSPTSIMRRINHSNLRCSQLTENTQIETPSSGIHVKKTPEYPHPKEIFIDSQIRSSGKEKRTKMGSGLKDAKPYRKDHSRIQKLKHPQYDLENRNLNNYVLDNTKTQNEDVLTQPMHDAPYNKSKLGLRPEYDNGTQSQNTEIPTQRALQPQVLQPQIPSQQVVQPQTQQEVHSQILTQQEVHPQIQTQQVVHPRIQLQQVVHPNVLTQLKVHPQIPTYQGVHPTTLSQEVVQPQIQTQPVVHQQTQTQQTVHPQTQNQQVLHPQIQTQQVLHPQIPTQQVLHPQTQNQQLGHPQTQNQQMGHPQTHAQQVLQPQIQTQQVLHPQIPTQQALHPQTQNQQMGHPQTHAQVLQPQIQTQQVLHPQIQNQRMGHPQTQNQQMGHPQTNAQQVLQPQIQTQQVLHPQIQTQQVLHPQTQNQQMGHPQTHVQQVLHPQIQTQQGLHPQIQTQQVLHPQIQSQPLVHPQIQTQPAVHPQIQTQPAVHPQIQTQQVVYPQIPTQQMVQLQQPQPSNIYQAPADRVYI